MESKPRKTRLEHSWDLMKENRRNLKRKDNSFLSYAPESSIKTPKVIYDSGELISNWSDGTITSGPVNLSSDHYSDKAGMPLPVNIGYTFQLELDIPKEIQPYVKPLITIEKIGGDLELKGMVSRATYWSWWKNYKQIKGDNTLLYQGYEPRRTFTHYYQDELDNGDFLEAHSSKWYYGTLKFSIGADNYELRNSYLFKARAYYNKTTSGAGGAYYNWDRMDAPAIDSISSSSCTGSGTYTESRMVDSGGGSWYQTMTDTKNETKTFNLFEDITHITASGRLYKNGVADTYYGSSSPLTVKFSGSLNGASTIPSGEAGNATLVSFDYAHTDRYRLWYSNKRARLFSAYGDTNWTLQNMPREDDYETGTLPYTNMTYKVNPDPHPQEVYPEWRQLGIDGESSETPRMTWTKSSQSGDTYLMKLSGDLLGTSKATKNNYRNIDRIDENYSHSSDTYSRDAENREDIQRNRFVVEPQEVKFRLQLVCTNSMYANELKPFIKQL